MPVKACFIDIDATITDDGDVRQINSGQPLNNAIINVLCDIMVDNGWERNKAADALIAHANDIIFWDYNDFIKEFNLPIKHSWNKIVKWHDDHLVVYSDAVDMIKKLYSMNMPLYIISNNPILGCLLKLQRAGLATLEGSPWFKDIIGSNNMKGQKGSVDFWQRAFIHTGLSPEDIVIIGDNLKDDCQVPRHLGECKCFLVDRKKPKPIEYKDGICFVNSLEYVVDEIKGL